MRILQVTPYFGEHYGGTERYCFNLSKALVEMGHDVQVFASRIKPATKCKEEIAGIKIHRFPTPTTIWNINPFSPMIHRLLTGNYDVVHVHSYLYFSANQALLAKIIRTAFRRKMSIVLHLHGGLGIPPYLKHQPIKKVAKHVYDATIGRIMMPNTPSTQFLAIKLSKMKIMARTIRFTFKKNLIIHFLASLDNPSWNMKYQPFRVNFNF